MPEAGLESTWELLSRQKAPGPPGHFLPAALHRYLQVTTPQNCAYFTPAPDSGTMTIVKELRRRQRLKASRSRCVRRRPS